MNFWATKLGHTQAPAPRQQYVPTQRAWWDDSPRPEPVMQQPQEQFQVPRQARGARASMTCPECGSGDYMSVMPEGPSVMVGAARARCFSCGYPYVQSGSGSVGIKGSGEVTASRQPHDGTSQIVQGFIAHLK